MKKRLKTTAILLAGGIGSRMQKDMPKQYLLLKDKEIALYSFDLFLESSEIDEVVVVCEPEYRALFSTSLKPLYFANPGNRRQDSVFNGFKRASSDQELFLIHDSARPFIDHVLIDKVLIAGQEMGAATLGLPVKFTVKKATSSKFVAETPDRSLLWEIQTPQVLKREILEEGFSVANDKGVTLTDDVSLAELIGKDVKLVDGSDKNIKITVPLDLKFANHLLMLSND